MILLEQCDLLRTNGEKLLDWNSTGIIAGFQSEENSLSHLETDTCKELMLSSYK